MNKKILYIIIGSILSSGVTYANEIKQMAPNQYDCTIDELELFITKRTENLRKESAVATWEDFKKTSQLAKSSPSNSTSNGNVQSEMARTASLKKTGSESAEEEDDCPLFFEDIPDLPDMSGIDLGDLSGLLGGGGLGDLQDFANKQMAQLAESLAKVLKEGICKRLSTEYLTELGTDILDDAMKEEIGYTTRDIEKGNFANKVINDSLKDEFGTSNAKLLNVMDDDLNDNRERYMKRQLKGQLDDMEDEAFE